MWPSRIVHVDGAGNGAACGDEVQLAVVEEPGILQRAVHTLGHRIVQRVACLRHADLCLDCKEHLHVLLRGVLDTAVGVVHHAGDADAEAGEALDGHRQCLCRAVRLKRLVEVPSHNVAAVGIRQQRQVAEALTAPDVGYESLFC